jgi:hypothetical protein
MNGLGSVRDLKQMTWITAVTVGTTTVEEDYWSSGIGQSRDHVVSSHLHVVVTARNPRAASTIAIGDTSGVSILVMRVRFDAHLAA